MDALRGWLLSVFAVSLIAGIAQTIMPSGPVKAVGSLACALLVFLAVARPMLGVRYELLADRVRDYAAQVTQTQAALTESKNTLNQTIIAEQSRAYSLDKTKGLDCELELVWDWTQEPPQIAGARVRGTLDREQQETLINSLCNDLGLRRDQIVFITPEEEP
jgi:hypothetical protein